MALPADFNKIFGSTATGGLTPIGDVNYAKGWEFVGSNPPTKNDFSYLQNLSDLKSQWLYSNKLQRTNPFGDIKADGSAAVARSNLDLGTAATKNVGTGAGQIPDMSSWTSGSGWRKTPDGTIEQWGTAIGDSLGNATVYYPIAFSSRPSYVGFCNLQSGVPGAVQNVVINNDNFDYAGFSCRNLAFNGTVLSGSVSSFMWFARGK